MGIKPALGWLGLLLFTTTAQAEGTRELLKGPYDKSMKAAARAGDAVTPKTKAPGPVIMVNASSSRAALGVVETTGKPRSDYDAFTYAGMPLDSALAKERGLEKGLVHMVFEHQRRASFRVERDRIRRVVRLAAERSIAIAAHANGTQPNMNVDHIDVLDTEDGVVVVDTASGGGGMFVTSDVYVFARNATLDQRIGAVEAVPTSVRGRLREALVAAEWMVIPNANANTAK
jgi:hypothetical protein